MEIIPAHGIVYLITCLVNGKKYVGQTVDSLAKRIRGHFSDAKRLEANRPLYNALNKYGQSGFKVDVLVSCVDQKQLDLMEDLYILSLNTMHRDFGYNRKRGGANGKISEETKKLLSDARRESGSFNYRHDVDTKEIIGLYASGLSTIKIGELLSVDKTTVWSRLKKAGIELRKESFTRSPELKNKLREMYAGEKSSSYRQDISNEEIILLYDEGFSTSDIGLKLGVDGNTVRNRLLKSGIELRPASRTGKSTKNGRSIPTSEIVKLREAGMSTDEISLKFSISPSTVRDRIAKSKRT